MQGVIEVICGGLELEKTCYSGSVRLYWESFVKVTFHIRIAVLIGRQLHVFLKTYSVDDLTKKSSLLRTYGRAASIFRPCGQPF